MDTPNMTSENLNDLNSPFANYNIFNGTLSVASIEDNTQYPSTNDSQPKPPIQRRKGVHKSTISSFVLEIARQCHENGVYDNANTDIDTSRTPQNSEETAVKVPFRSHVKRANLRRNRTRRHYVQRGDENIMFIYEPKESKSVDYYKQVGNKNVMVHLSMSSNLCQLVDKNDGIIPLDTSGEVWLEIKRRSRVRGEQNGESMTSDSEVPRPVVGENNGPVPMDTENMNCSPSCAFDNLVYYNGRLPTENTESYSASLDNLDQDDHYATICIHERHDSLKIKFSKHKRESVLDIENLDKTSIMSHRKVIDFLIDKGNDFDVTIQDWEYEKESVYSYIPSHLVDGFFTDCKGVHRDEAASFNDQPHYQTVDECTISLTDNGTTRSEEDDGLYSIPHRRRNVIVNPVYNSEKNAGPEKKSCHNDMSSLLNGSCAHEDFNRKPVLCSENGRKLNDAESTSRLPRNTNFVAKKNMPVTLSPLKIQPHPVVPPPVPERMYRSLPTSNQEEKTTPPQPPDISKLHPRCQSDDSSHAPQMPDRGPASPSPEIQIRIPSPRGRRQLRLPPIPGYHVIDNLHHCEWYHGKLEPGSGKHILANRENGSFLLRDAQGQIENHVYTIEVKDDLEIKKLMIMKKKDRFHFSEFSNKTYGSVVEMVEVVIKTGLKVKEAGTNTWKIINVKPVSKYT